MTPLSKCDSTFDMNEFFFDFSSFCVRVNQRTHDVLCGLKASECILVGDICSVVDSEKSESAKVLAHVARRGCYMLKSDPNMAYITDIWIRRETDTYFVIESIMMKNEDVPTFVHMFFSVRGDGSVTNFKSDYSKSYNIVMQNGPNPFI